MTFADAIGLQRGDVLALVGAGGKTTLTALLGVELLARGEPVACCATTMTLLPAPGARVRVMFTNREDAAAAIRDALESGQLPWVAGEPSSQRDPACHARDGMVQPIALTDAKVAGAAPADIDRIHAALPDVTLIVEADGARHRWLKAPADYEPQLPASTAILSSVAHLGILGKPLTEEFVHRPERVARILDAPMGTILTPQMVAAILTHPEGGLKGWQPGMRAVPILTLPDADFPTPDDLVQALLENSRVSHVVLAWLGETPWVQAIHRPTPQDSRRPVVGVLLAAGGSSRLGKPKQLLPFGGTTLVEHALDILLRSPVDEVVVVLGAHAEEIAPRLQKPRVRVVLNPRWEQGQSTSLHAALDALPPDCAAMVFVPCDMPWISPELIAEIIATWERTGKPLVATLGGEVRGIPALIAREIFPELKTIPGDQGCRVLIRGDSARVAHVQADPRLLADIDTPEQYQAALEEYHRRRQGEQMQHLKSIRNLIVDMDGVLYRGDAPIPGIVPFFRFLRENRIRFLLATNNSTLTPQEYSEKMARMGVDIPPESILTSGLAAADYLAARYPKGTRVHVIGEAGLRQALASVGFVLADEDVAAVVVGMDRQVTFEKLARATLLIRAGALFVGTNPDKTLPVPEGEIPGNGALLALLEAASGVQPLVIGKPEKHLYEIAMRRLGAPKETTAALGDRLETDILGAERAGLFSIMVLSGVSTREQALTSPHPPNLIFQDVGELTEAWRVLLDGA
ncbi:MAG: putative selenium-dependent hydroxylase accessory protein YqeC [Chloroflexi bacterium]|nr:putative selenium-dependent hydroxylase accessory protein YqeC [Chloroflexota bacterium]